MKKSLNSYSDFYKYYDTYMSEADYDDWYSYLKFMSGLTKWRNKNVLDIACGTGNILVPFVTDTNANFFGIDNSEGMLSIADKKLFDIKPSLRNKVHLICADMLNLSTNTKFDFIYSAGDSINYIGDFDKLAIFLSNIKSIQKENAVFTFDILNYDYDYNLHTKEIYDKTEFGINRKVECINNIKYLITDVFVDKEKKAHHRQRIYQIDDIKNAAAKASYTNIEFYNFLSDKPFDNSYNEEKIQVLLK